MFLNLSLGALVISATVVIHTLGLIAVTRAVGKFTDMFRLDGRRNRIVAMVVIVIGLFAIMTIEIWLWAISHHLLGVTEDFETALYFSIVTFSTLGYGDVLPAQEWRLFAGLEGVDGLLLIGWSTAYLIASGVRVGPFKSGEEF